MRTNLLPKNLEMLLFKKYNWRALSYRIELCSPPSDFIPPNYTMYDGADEIEKEQEEEPVQLPEHDMELDDLDVDDIIW